MNFLELIQAVSKMKTGEAPSTFGDTADEDYLKIKEEIIIKNTSEGIKLLMEFNQWKKI